MPFLQAFLAKIQSLADGAADFFRGLIKQRAGPRFAGKARELALGLWAKIPEEKRRPVMVYAGGGLAVLLLVFTGALLLARKSGADTGPAQNAAAARTVIPPEELFLPDEPDFVPGVLLERERRTSWTVEDAAPFWQDPLKNGEEQWRERVEKSIDELLERVR
jgi:hypothetical protein